MGEGVNYACRIWDDDRELDIPKDDQRNRMLMCVEEGITPEEGSEDVVLRCGAGTHRMEEEFLRRHTYLVRAQDYTWVNHYTDTYSTREQKKARYFTVMGPTGSLVGLRYYEVDLVGDFPKFFCRLDCCLGAEFAAAQEAGTTLPVMQVGYGRVEVDVRPTVYENTLRDVKTHLGLSADFSSGCLWDIMVSRVPLNGLGQHSRPLKSQYGGTTLRDAMERMIANEGKATS
jgi:hypothetical protein